jgi:hypothetical protein
MNLPFELGPIRPVDEADSLLIRTTRNCPWNKCAFCVNYHSEKFSIRSTAEIKKDIEAAADYYNGHRFKRCFLQDGDSLVMKTKDLLEILQHLKMHFPALEIISSYGRSQSIIRKSSQELKDICEAGLNLLYCGMESGSDTVLKRVNKGVNASQVVSAGNLAKQANMCLSEFIILGLGGTEHWQEHATATAAALNAINPDKIRVLTIGIKDGSDLQSKWVNGTFSLQTEENIIEEQRLLIENLYGITSHYANHHSVDLLMELRGQLPEDKTKLLSILGTFLDLNEHDKLNFILGRRLGIYRRLKDLENSRLYLLVDRKLQDIGASTRTDLEHIFHSLRAQVV